MAHRVSELAAYRGWSAFMETTNSKCRKEESHACICRKYDGRIQSRCVGLRQPHLPQRKPHDANADADANGHADTNAGDRCRDDQRGARKWRAVLLTESGNAAGRPNGRV